MKRQNFLERATYDLTNEFHVFKPLTNAVTPEIYEISFVNIDSETVVSVIFQDVLDSGDTAEFAQDDISVAADATFDLSFETSHSQVKVKLTNGSLAGDKTATVRCIAGPRSGGVNSTGFGAAITGLST